MHPFIACNDLFWLAVDTKRTRELSCLDHHRPHADETQSVHQWPVVDLTNSRLRFAVLVYMAAAIFSFNRDEVSIGLVEISLWPHRFMIAVGLTVLTFQSVVSGLDLLLNGKHPFAPDQAIELAQTVRQQTL